MARDFANSSANNLSFPTAYISGTDPRPITVSVWSKANNSTVSTHYSLFSNGDAGGDPRFFWDIQNAGSDGKMMLYSNAYSPGATFTWTAGTWRHFAMSWSAGTTGTVTYYVDGVKLRTDPMAIGTGGSGGECVIGGLTDKGGVGGFDVDGHLAEFGIWSEVLTDDEVVSISRGICPLLIRPQNIEGYMPLLGNNSPEIDLVSGRGFSLAGTLTKVSHTRVYYPALGKIGCFDTGAAPPAGAAADTSGFFFFFG